MARDNKYRSFGWRKTSLVVTLLTGFAPLNGLAETKNLSLLEARRCEVNLESNPFQATVPQSAEAHERFAQAAALARRDLNFFIANQDKYGLSQEQKELIGLDFLLSSVIPKVSTCQNRSCFREQMQAWGKWLPPRLKALGISEEVRAGWLEKIPPAPAGEDYINSQLATLQRIYVGLYALDLRDSSQPQTAKVILDKLNGLTDAQIHVNEFVESDIAGKNLLKTIVVEGPKSWRGGGVLLHLYLSGSVRFTEMKLEKEVREKIAIAMLKETSRRPLNIGNLIRDFDIQDVKIQQDVRAKATAADQIEVLRQQIQISSQDLEKIEQLLLEVRKESRSSFMGSSAPHRKVLLRLAGTPAIPEAFLRKMLDTLSIAKFDYGDFEFCADLSLAGLARTLDFGYRLSPDAHPFDSLIQSMSAASRAATIEFYIKKGHYLSLPLTVFETLPNGREHAFRVALRWSDENLSEETIKKIVDMSRALNFTEDQIREIARQNYNLAMALGIDKLNVDDFRFLLAKWAKRLAGIDKISQTDVNSGSTLLALAKKHLNEESKFEILFILAPKYSRFMNLLNNLGLATYFRTEERLRFAMNPIQTINATSKELLPKIDDETPAGKVHSGLQSFAHLAPSLFPPSQANDVRPMTNAHSILSAVSLRTELEIRLGYSLTQLSPLELAAVTLGLDVETLRKADFSQGQIADLIISARDISRSCGLYCLSRFNYEFDLTKKKNKESFLSLVTTMRDYAALRTAKDLQLSDLAQKIGKVDAQSLAEAEKFLQNEVVAAVQNIFAGQLKNFDYERFRKLNAEWGDLKPIWTLVARYKQSHPIEIPVLGRIFEHSLNGTFRDYKYMGDPSDSEDQKAAKEQLSSLRDQDDVRVLQTPRSNLQLHSSSADVEVTDQQLFNQSTVIITTNVVPNLSRKGIRLSDASAADAHTLLMILPTSPSNPIDMIEQIMRDPRLQNGAQTGDRVFAALISALSDAKDLNTRRMVARMSLAMAQKHLVPALSNRTEETQETINDLRELNQKLTPAVSTGGSAIVFVTTLHHPKTLLSIGDWVQAASCQNYKTGGMIQTLPSYVIDANITAVAGYALTNSHFAGGDKEFHLLQAAIKAKSTIHSQFDEINKVITFTWNDNGVDSKLSTKPIPYAYHRQIVRLGALSSDKGPGLFMERAYTQSHFAGGTIETQARRLVESMATDMRAEMGQSMRITGSRNALGGYTDAGGGVQGKGSAYYLNQ